MGNLPQNYLNGLTALRVRENIYTLGEVFGKGQDVPGYQSDWQHYVIVSNTYFPNYLLYHLPNLLNLGKQKIEMLVA